MKTNLGTVDRAIRTIVAIVIGLLLLTEQITGTVGAILGVFALVFLLTSAIGFCPLYLPFGISTKKEALTQS
jgi:hypothetical protein